VFRRLRQTRDQLLCKLRHSLHPFAALACAFADRFSQTVRRVGQRRSWRRAHHF
jgi:hypothetical protein